MLQNEPLNSPEEALNIIQSTHLVEGLEGVISLLADYAGEAILAEDPIDKDIVSRNHRYITQALEGLEAAYQPELMRLWPNILREAMTAARVADVLERLSERLKSIEPDFNSILESLVLRFEASDPLGYELIPLSHLCKSFQDWALDAESILNQSKGREADVTVYNLAAAVDNALCLIVVNVKAETEGDGKEGAELKMTLPLSCLSNESHFKEKHVEDMDKLFNELLANL